MHFLLFLSWPHECELTWALSLRTSKNPFILREHWAFRTLSWEDHLASVTYSPHSPWSLMCSLTSPHPGTPRSSFTSTLSSPEVRFILSCHSLTNCVSSYGLISFSLRITHTHACSYLTASVSLGVLVVQLGCPCPVCLLAPLPDSKLWLSCLPHRSAQFRILSAGQPVPVWQDRNFTGPNF